MFKIYKNTSRETGKRALMVRLCPRGEAIRWCLARVGDLTGPLTPDVGDLMGPLTPDVGDLMGPLTPEVGDLTGPLARGRRVPG